MAVDRGVLRSIQVLRFMAATSVVLFHAHQAVTAQMFGGAEPSRAYLFGFGAVGVHIFFVISGYIMFLTSFRDERGFRPAQFLVRRANRIYPNYWMFACLYIAVHPFLGSAYRLSPADAAGALLLWPRDASLIIGPAWTLAFELYFYAAFALFMLLGARRGPVTLGAFFVLSVAVGALVRPSDPLATMATNTLLLEFVAGVFIARLTASWPAPRWIGWCAICLSFAGFAAGLAVGYDRFPSVLAWGGPSALLVLGAVILDASGGVRGVERLSRLGDSSYSLYLCHILVIDVCIAAMRATGPAPSALTAVLAVSAISILFAHMFHLAVERRVVDALNRATRSWTKAGVPRTRPM